MDYHELIEREKRRRALLVQKVDETDRRIAMLNAMSDQSDPLDKWLDEQTASLAATAASSPRSKATEREPSAQMTRETPRKISAQWIDLIAYLALDGKDFSQVQEFLVRSGSPMTPGSVRTGLMNYRKDYGLVANPRPGFYTATPKGMEFIEAYRARELSK